MSLFLSVIIGSLRHIVFSSQLLTPDSDLFKFFSGMSLFLSVINGCLRHIGLSFQLPTPLSDLFSFFFCDLTDVTLSVIEYWQF